LLYNNSDQAKLEKRISDTFPEKDYIRQVYEHLAYYYQIATGDGYGVLREFNIEAFCQRFHHFPIRVHAALQLLQRSGYIEYNEEADNQARVRFLVGRDDLYQLDHLSPDEERVVVALLRNYGGLFADYAFIDESIVAQQAGLTPPQTYEILKELSQRRLLHFIPRRNIPTIRYMQRREDAEHIVIPPHVYEERREQYRERIHAMLHYATSDDLCRSRQLLAYFGENITHNCGQCDVCQSKPQDADAIRQHILTLLNDHQPHPIGELSSLPYSTDDVSHVLTQLIQEEQVEQQDGQLQVT
jgi:ATP-dependent DNA helicase RecQ